MGADQPVARSLSEAELLGLLKRAAAELGVQAWVVGGYVRDKLLGRNPTHPDVVVEGGDSLELARRFAAMAGAPAPAVFERFGTAQVTVGERLVEFVTARAESYAAESRKPVVRPASLLEDLRRRDLTINTLLMDFDGAVEDRLGGGADLRARLLRTPLDPVQTFSDDPLRMMRTIRFAAELGFELAPDLLPAMRRMAARLGPPVVSVERMADEFKRMLVSERPELALSLLDQAGLLEMVLPELAACRGVAQGGYHTHDVLGHSLRTVGGTPPDLPLRLAAALHDVGKPATATPEGAFTGHEIVGAELARVALERLRFPHDEIAMVETLIRLHLRPVYYRSDWKDGAVRRLARDAGAQLDRMMALAKADIGASAYPEPQKLDELDQRLRGVLDERPSRIGPLVSGDDIMRVLGLPPGVEVGRIKRRIEELVLDGELPPSAEQILDYLRVHRDL